MVDLEIKRDQITSRFKPVDASDVPTASVQVRQASSDFLQQHFGSKRLLNEPVGYSLGKPQISLAVAAGHQDSQSGMNHEALIHKLVNGHRKAAVVRDQEIRLLPVRSQGCQR